MTIRLVNSNELDTLLTIVRQTFIDTYEQLNDDDNFQAYLQTHFTREKLREELKGCSNDENTEGVSSPTQKQFYYFSVDDNINGYFKIIVNKSPLEAVSPVIYDIDIDFKNIKALEIERIYVVNAIKGQGVGRQMIEKIQNIAIKNGCSYIWLGVWIDNPAAIAFYQKMGFKVFGEHIFMMGNDAQKDFLMLKWLD